MAAVRVSADVNTGLSYRTTDAAGNPVVLQVVSPTTGATLPPNSPGGWLRIDGGAVSTPTFLSQGNVTDLLAVLTQFSRFGSIS
jgi:hypothetical protein